MDIENSDLYSRFQNLLSLVCVCCKCLVCGFCSQGMGGQHGYFGLWIDSDYGKGHSKAKPRCTTYNSPQLAAKEDFTLDAMEVWAVGDVPESAGVGEQTWNLWNCVLIGTGNANAKLAVAAFWLNVISPLEWMFSLTGPVMPYIL